MASVSITILIGNLGKDPETRFTNGGMTICSFPLATTYKGKKASGEYFEETEWHNVVFFGRQAEVCQKYLQKGSPLFVIGRIRTNRYEKDGVVRYKTEIIGTTMQLLGQRNDSSKQDSPKSFDDMPDDDMPF